MWSSLAHFHISSFRHSAVFSLCCNKINGVSHGRLRKVFVPVYRFSWKSTHPFPPLCANCPRFLFNIDHQYSLLVSIVHTVPIITIPNHISVTFQFHQPSKWPIWCLNYMTNKKKTPAKQFKGKREQVYIEEWNESTKHFMGSLAAIRVGFTLLLLLLLDCPVCKMSRGSHYFSGPNQWESIVGLSQMHTFHNWLILFAIHNSSSIYRHCCSGNF